MRFLLVALAGASLVAAACSSSDSAPASPSGDVGGAGDGGVPAGPITFHKHVEPILQKVCQNCHVAGGIAPFALVTYDDAKSVGGLIVQQTGARTMPPWGAQDTAECKPPMPWKNDLRLSEQEIAILAAWHTGGNLEGDPKDAPPPRTSMPATHLEGALSLAPATPFTLAGTNDTFKCFVLDPKITATTYLTATNFVPTNKTIVHHALAFAIPATAKVPGDTYDCFGGPGIDNPTLVAAWAPGPTNSLGMKTGILSAPRSRSDPSSTRAFLRRPTILCSTLSPLTREHPSYAQASLRQLSSLTRSDMSSKPPRLTSS